MSDAALTDRYRHKIKTPEELRAAARPAVRARSR